MEWLSKEVQWHSVSLNLQSANRQRIRSGTACYSEAKDLIQSNTIILWSDANNFIWSQSLISVDVDVVDNN